MAFQTPITIRKALDNIQKRDYVLPAIQREVVWRPEQIERLFDSLMQGYPIGSFLFWKIDADHSKDFVFYEFMTHYHQRDHSHLDRLSNLVEPKPITGVLDGQQRLTALNIGLRGSHAVKLPRLWVTSPNAFPVKHLHLRLDGPAPENELGMEYDFKFLSEQDISDRVSKEEHWFRVSNVLELDSTMDVIFHLQEQGLGNEKVPARALGRLHTVVHTDPIISAYEEEAQDLDRVLNIFIRVNSGGTVLSYSDLLLSIATAQWTGIDARQVIYNLVDELNDTGRKFNFNKDLVLKSGLVLCDLPGIGFRVTNFNTSNMARLEQNWNGIASSLRLAVRLLSDFGFYDQILTADSVVIPLAYYIHTRQLTEGYLGAVSSREDRERIRRWVVRSLIKGGIWGSGLDQLLLALRMVLQENGDNPFPVERLESVMAQRGKSLQFSSEELDDLAEIRISDRRVFPLLSILYPYFDLRHEFHIDHIFPRSRFTAARLQRAGVAPDTLDEFQRSVDQIPNLQLLEGPTNTSKQAALPLDWMNSFFKDEGSRSTYILNHDLGTVPAEVTGFMAFYDARRSRIREKLNDLLGTRIETTRSET